MPQRSLKRIMLMIACGFLSLLSCPGSASAQRVEDSCPAFLKNAHQALDCIEAVFTQTDIPYHMPHLTLSSIPPGNGFPIGFVFEKRTHNVTSPFSETGQPEGTISGFKSIMDIRAAFVGSSNASWYATGSFTWLPPIHYRDWTPPGRTPCHRIKPICTSSVLGIHFYLTHRTLQTMSYYGLGPSAPDIQSTYLQSETYGGAVVHMPLLNWLTFEGRIENRLPDVAFSSASVAGNTITEANTPGIATQPDFMHYDVGLITHEQAVSEPVTNDAAVTPPGATPPPLMKHKFVFTFDNTVSQHWYSDLGNGHYSFRQFVVDGDESIKLHSVIRKFVPPSAMTTQLKILEHFCNQRKSGLKTGDECDFGDLSFRPLLVLSTANSGEVPFYFQPTLGGSNIDSRPTLRGFADYRFRAPDAALISVDYGIPVYDPIGALLFYDVGDVGSTSDSLSFTHARQDAGAGVTVRFLNNVVAQIYLGFGAGHGAHFGWNFTKLF